MPTWIANHKGYWVALALGLLVAAHSLNWVPDGLYQTLLGLLGATGIAVNHNTIAARTKV